jgi:endonuclease/exonuclease/phosphatase family metal-dependent hydrolase
MNILGATGDWPQREALVRAGLEEADADLVALQETVVDATHDQTLGLLDLGYVRVHQKRRGPHGVGLSLATRWPVVVREEIDLLVSPRVDPQDWLGVLVAAVVQAPEPLGPVIFASPKPSYQRGFEHEREQQAVHAARRLEEMATRYGAHVILASDFDAVPESASMRFWRGMQSLDGLSVAYCDAWGATHPGEPGLTFDPANPLVQGHWRHEPGRRLDYILIRCDDHGPTLWVDRCHQLLADDRNGRWASDHYGVLAELSHV